MNSKDKIEYLKKGEKNLMRIAKYLLIGFGGVYALFLLVVFTARSRDFESSEIVTLLSTAFPWLFLGIVITIILIAIIATLEKYAISAFAYSVGDRKTGANNLFPALLATLLLFFLLSMFLMALMPNHSRSKARDARRISDMRQLAGAQVMYFNEAGLYFTCSQTGGDCGGSNGNYPSFIGNYLKEAPLDPNGNEHCYGGIDNTVASGRFCYFANLENTNTAAPGCSDGCDFYTATELGNFYVRQRPDTIDACINKEQTGAAVTDKK